MNKKLGRLIQPSLGLYFVVLLGFSVASAFCRYYILAAAEAGVTAILFFVYMMQKNHRRRELQAFIQSVSDVAGEARRNESPFPMVVARMNDSGVIWSNNRFSQITGFKDGMVDKKLTDLIPGFSTDWLLGGKNEYPYDVTLDNRRYRVYGNTVRADDPDQSVLGVL